MDRAAQAVEVLHAAQRHQHGIAVELLVADLENAHHHQFAGEKHLVVFEPLNEQRRGDRDLAADHHAERIGQLRTEDNRVVVEGVQRADADETVEWNDAVHPVDVDALDDREGRFATEFEHAHALGKRGDAEHAGDLGDGFNQRLGLVDQGAGTDLHVALGVDDHPADFVTETAHHAVGHHQGGHAQRYAEDRNRREK